MDKDTTEIFLANVGALSLSFTDIHQILQILSLVAALSFTIYKFIKEVRNGNTRK
jgi:hypothetical protein